MPFTNSHFTMQSKKNPLNQKTPTQLSSLFDSSSESSAYGSRQPSPSREPIPLSSPMRTPLGQKYTPAPSPFVKGLKKSSSLMKRMLTSWPFVIFNTLLCFYLFTILCIEGMRLYKVQTKRCDIGEPINGICFTPEDNDNKLADLCQKITDLIADKKVNHDILEWNYNISDENKVRAASFCPGLRIANGHYVYQTYTHKQIIIFSGILFLIFISIEIYVLGGLRN